MDSILAYDPTSHPDDKPPDYVSSRPRRLSPDEAKLDELSNYAKHVLGNISNIKPYLRNGNFHEVIGILGGTTLREFNKCREGKTIPPYIRSSDPRSHNVHHKVDEVNNQGSNDNKSLQEAHSDDSDKRTSKKSSLSSNTGLERNKSIKKERHYDGNQEIESTSDQALSSSYHRGVPSDRKVKTEVSNGPDSFLPSALSSSYHRGVPSDRKVKTEISNGPDSFLPSVSNETIAKTTTLSKRNQGPPSANNDFCVADDTKTSQNKEDTKTKDEDELLQASENNNKIKRQKADNDTKATTVRPKELKIDIIQNGIAKGMIKSTSDEKVSMIAKVKQICEEMVGLPPPISAIRTPSSSSSAFPAFQQKDEATSNRKDIKKESEENNFTDDQNCLEQDLELTDDSDSDNQSDAVEDLTRNGNNAISGKLFPIIDPTPLSESSSESDSDSDIGAVKQVKKRKTPSSDNRKHSPRQKKTKIDNTSEKEENKAAADQHNELFEDVDNSDQQQQQRSPIQNDAVVSSTLPPTADKSYPVSFDLSRLKSIKLSTSKAKKHQDEQAQGFKDKKINVDKQLTSTSGSKDGSLSSGISKSKRINNHNNEGHPLKKKIRNKMAESSDEANVTAVSSRKGISPERNEMKRNKKSDDFKVVSHGKVSEKERLKKASRSIIGSEDDSALLRHKKDKKRKKEIRRVKTSDDDSSSHHRTPPPFKNDNDQSEVQDRGKNCDYKASQSKHLDSDNTQRRKKSVAKESNKDYRSDMAATTFNNQTLKKNTEEVSTIEDLRIKSENLRKQATEHKRSGDANPNIEVKAIKYTEAAMLFIEQALIEEKLDKEKHESRKKEPYYEILNTTATFLKQICRILRDLGSKDGWKGNIKLKKFLFFCDRSRALLVHKIFLRSRNEIRTLLQNVNEYCAKDKQQMGSISKNSRTSDLSVSPTFTPGSQSSTSSSSTQNDNFISIPNKIMSMQLRLNHLWNQETYAMDLWENGNLIMKEFEDFFTQLHQRNILHYDSTLADLLNYVRRGMKLISKN